MENYSKKTPAKKRQPEQSAESEAANVDSAKVEFTKPKGGKRLFSKGAVKEESGDVKVSDQKPSKRRWWGLLYYPVWTYGAFLISQVLVYILITMLGYLNVPFGAMNETAFVTLVTALSFSLAIVIAIMAPKAFSNSRTTLKELGLSDYPRWMDIILAVLAFVVYLIASSLTVMLVTMLVPFEINHSQELPFDSSMLTSAAEYWLVFSTLVLVAPFAEEVLFRGYMYGKLRKFAPVWVSVLVASIAFGLAHLWAPGSALQVMVTIDTFVISLFLCLLREHTGAIWASFLLHAIKNCLAFYVLFINPSLVDQLQASILPLF